MIKLFFFTLVFSCVSRAGHQIQIQLFPEAHRLQAVDTLKFDSEKSELVFSLHKDLQITKLEPVVTSQIQLNGNYKVYTFQFSQPIQQLVVSYQGEIFDNPEVSGDSRGSIQSEGVALFGGSGWYPLVENWITSSEVEVTMPKLWRSVSVGEKISTKENQDLRTEKWLENTPQEEMQIFAGVWHEYRAEKNGHQAYIYLRQPDESLAQLYQQNTFDSLVKYEALLGPYAYKRFSLVENFWETGYGMPGFTLLGPQVIRLPFLTQSSYPHEILHNWWGNSVYVDFKTGNWCEGLTTYLADHDLAAKRMEGVDYRRGTLENYKNFVKESNDFPLSEFRNRHSEATQAIGYGKSMMFFHMLKKQIGEDLFFKSLQNFYSNFKFRVASYTDIKTTFESVSGMKLDQFFNQWVLRTGAPILNLNEASRKQELGVWKTKFKIGATGEYSLLVPVRVEGRASGEVVKKEFQIQSASQFFEIETSFEPSRLMIDPEFDVFRKLFDEEVPESVSKFLGNEAPITFIIERGASAQAFVDQIRKNLPEVKVIFDDQSLPAEAGRIWVLGWNNKYLSEIQKRAEGLGIIWGSQGIAGTVVANQSEHSASLILDGWAWSAVADQNFWSRLAQKIPHYGKFSYMVFLGEKNIQKGVWPLAKTPLIKSF